jgi:hypothetical protein
VSYDFGLLNLVVSPFLEKIGREERLSGDPPRKDKNVKWKQHKKSPDSSEPETNQKTDDSESSPHIDLRI